IKVLSTVGTTSLGGVDFDQRLIDICIEKFSRNSKGKFSEDSIRDNKRLMHKIRIECEKAKKTLQQKSDARVKIDLPDGSDLVTQVTRKEFDNRCHDLYSMIRQYVERVFEDTDVNKNQAKEIILVGGSTRLKSLEKLLTDDGWVLNKRLNVDEAVARGAAIFANIIRLSRPIVIHEVTPFRYALTTFVDQEKNTNKNVNNVTVIVDRNVELEKSGNCLLAMKYPNSEKPKNSITFGHSNKYNLKNEDSFSNGYEKHDSSFSFNINVVTDDTNKFLTYEELLKFQVTHSWKNTQYFLLDVNFEINYNGICKFEVKPKEYKDAVTSPICNSKHETVQLNPGLSIDEIARMKSNFNKYETEIESEKKRIICKNTLQSQLFKMKHCLKNAVNQMDKEYILVYNHKIQAINDWVDQNSKASIDELNEKIKDAQNIKQEIEQCKAEYRKIVDQKIEKLKTVLTTINNNLIIAKSMSNSEELRVIEKEVNTIHKWVSDNQYKEPSKDDVIEKLIDAGNIAVKLNQLKQNEDQIRMDARINLGQFIENIVSVPFF
ncbi:cytoplasmic heat shock protein 70-like protein, partial [Leptotrombidium deliense]